MDNKEYPCNIVCHNHTDYPIEVRITDTKSEIVIHIYQRLDLEKIKGGSNNDKYN